jgi:hypothetical protein
VAAADHDLKADRTRSEPIRVEAMRIESVKAEPINSGVRSAIGTSAILATGSFIAISAIARSADVLNISV